MFKRLAHWLKTYWLTILLIAFLGCLYWALLAFVFEFLWPAVYQNGEPVTASLASTVHTRVLEREAFRDSCRTLYILMGGMSLVFYILYAWSGMLKMPYSEHARFGKSLRSSIVSCYVMVMLEVICQLFSIPGNSTLLLIILHGATVVSGVVYMFCVYRMLSGYRKHKKIGKFGDAFLAFLSLIVPATLVFGLQSCHPAFQQDWGTVRVANPTFAAPTLLLHL
jgi:hypothetical protein